MKENCTYYSFLIFFIVFSMQAQWRDSQFTTKNLKQLKTKEFFNEINQLKVNNESLRIKVEEQNNIIDYLNRTIKDKEQEVISAGTVVIDDAAQQIIIKNGATAYLQAQSKQIFNKGTLHIEGPFAGSIINGQTGEVIESRGDGKIIVHNNALPRDSNDFVWGVFAGASLFAAVGGLVYVAHSKLVQKQ